MEYEKVELDFVKRSLAILDQYDDYVRPAIPTEQHYEVTLLLNCLLGLIVLPFEHSKRQQNNIQFPRVCDEDQTLIVNLEQSWGLDKLKIEKFDLYGRKIKPGEATLRQIVAMFRHSMAHSQFGNGSEGRRPTGLSVDFKTDSRDPIESVIIEVNLVNEYRNQVEFVATISVRSLRIFATRFARVFIRENSDKANAS